MRRRVTSRRGRGRKGKTKRRGRGRRGKTKRRGKQRGGEEGSVCIQDEWEVEQRGKGDGDRGGGEGLRSGS
jgi:hypothetical protein